MSLIIRAIEPHELPLYSGLLLDVVLWLQNQGTPLWSPEQITPEALLKLYRLDEFYLAFLKNQPVAGMVLQEKDFLWDGVADGEALYLHKLAVSRTRAGQRLGRDMIDFARQEAARRKKPLLRLDTSAKHPKLCKYYEDYGFEFVGYRHLEDYGFHVNFYQMPIDEAPESVAESR
ncbi:GNAT family N-acetyltransferase [Deinococcus roseus]|nr:GNAT family N-acetyltransferase [Deinococcus roseus]